MRVGREGIEAPSSGRPVSGLAELATVLLPRPSIRKFIGSSRWTAGAPPVRRLGCVHVEPSFVDHCGVPTCAEATERCAANASASFVVNAWDPELIEAGQVVADYRRRYMEQLVPHVAEVGTRC